MGEASTTSNRIFISWSGPRSGQVAAAIRDLIRQVVQASDPWMSSKDIGPGSRWGDEIAAELSKAVVGVIVVTAENHERPWLNFEAGAISKAVGGVTYTCPYLFGVERSQVTGPLSQFQMVEADTVGTRSIVERVNEAIGSPLSATQLGEAFDAF